MLGRKEKKATQWVKQTKHFEEINQKVLSNDWRQKKIRDRIKQYRQNWIFQNNVKKFFQQVRGYYTKTYLKAN